MPIDAKTPTEVPASEAKVYDKYWLKHFVIMANDPSKKIRVTATLQKALVDKDGNWELSPVDDDVVIRVADFDSIAGENNALTKIKEDLLNVIKAVGMSQNKL